MGKMVYGAAAKLPDSERFGLIAGVRRSGINVASHIAQGYGRGNTQDYLWFLKQARGEMYQFDTQLLFALDFKYLSQDDYEVLKNQLDEAERVLAGLIRSLGGKGLDASMPRALMPSVSRTLCSPRTDL